MIQPFSLSGESSDKLQLHTANDQIWLGEQRMVLLHAGALGALRKELVDTLGLDRARGLLTRMGYEAGVRDAKSTQQAMVGKSVCEQLEMGPQLHTVEGIVKVSIVRLEADPDRQHYYGEFVWDSSFEDKIHQEVFGPTDHPVCWSQIGYACGYASTLMGGTFVLFKEVECRAQGNRQCRIVGRPAQTWEDQNEVEKELRYFKPDAVAEQLLQLQNQVEQLRVSLGECITLGDMVGRSASFCKACDMIRKAAASQVTVLLLGETGVGKEMFARALHSVSERSKKPFLAVNCAAIPEDLIESELFGVEKGAFTGALSSRPGRFERAHDGTLFLDEIGELSLNAQAKLLRVLQEGEVERVGDTQTRQVDVRLVAATNVDIERAVEEGRFRKDLMYRINIFPVEVPPLRERKEDIAVLAERFIAKHAVRHAKQIRGVTEQALAALEAYDWPGNIRELENVIERGIILTPSGARIDVDELFPYARSSADGADAMDTVVKRLLAGQTTLEALENQAIAAAVAKYQGNLSAAARTLGITRRQMAYRWEKLREDQH